MMIVNLIGVVCFFYVFCTLVWWIGNTASGEISMSLWDFIKSQWTFVKKLKIIKGRTSHENTFYG